MNSLIYSDTTGEILSPPEEEKRESNEANYIVVRYYRDNSGWKYSIQLKMKKLIKCKPCLQSDKPEPSKTSAALAAEKTVYSWLSKPQKKQFSVFSVFNFSQPSLFPELD